MTIEGLGWGASKSLKKCLRHMYMDEFREVRQRDWNIGVQVIDLENIFFLQHLT